LSVAAGADVLPNRGLYEVSHEWVELRGGFWGPRLKTHHETTIGHELDCLERNGHVTNFDKAAGVFDGPHNSGIGFRCANEVEVKGYQCEIANEQSEMIYAVGSGWLWPKDAEQKKQFQANSEGIFDNAKWNTFRIRCEEDRIQIWIDDKHITDVRDDRFQSGSVALQHHGKGGVHRFRNVRIRRLGRTETSSVVDKPSNQWFSVTSIVYHNEALNGAHDVELSGNLAFVPGKGGSIAVIDVAEPEKPVPEWWSNEAIVCLRQIKRDGSMSLT